MKLDIENIIILQTVMKSLSQGVDPTSNIAFPDDTILNSKILQSCFSDVCEIFDLLRRNIDAINNLPLRKATNQKLPFHVVFALLFGAISGLQQTVLRSKTDAMRSERT